MTPRVASDLFFSRGFTSFRWPSKTNESKFLLVYLVSRINLYDYYILPSEGVTCSVEMVLFSRNKLVNRSRDYLWQREGTSNPNISRTVEGSLVPYLNRGEISLKIAKEKTLIGQNARGCQNR